VHIHKGFAVLEDGSPAIVENRCLSALGLVGLQSHDRPVIGTSFAREAALPLLMAVGADGLARFDAFVGSHVYALGGNSSRAAVFATRILSLGPEGRVVEVLDRVAALAEELEESRH